MKILIVASYLPYPLYSGGHIRLYNLMRLLSKSHEITLICEKRGYQSQEDIKEVEKVCKEVITVDRNKQWTIGNILKTGLSWYPFLLVGHASSEMKKEISKKLAEGFDLIHIETFYVMQNVPPTRIPIVLVEHNIEYLVYYRFLKQSPFFLWPLLFIDVIKLQFCEQYYWRRATKLIAVSEKEKNIMKREDVIVVPNGVDIEKYKKFKKNPKISRKDKRVLFIGDFKWVQNRDAVEWLLKEIWPTFVKTSAGEPKTKLWIVGKEISENIKRLTTDENVIFDENAPGDTVEIYNQADVLLAPIRVGGGTSYKVLESMASGVAVVTTPLGIEGIDARDNQEVLLGETAKELAEKVTQVLENDALYEKIVGNAREKIEEKYDWKNIAKKLEKVYESV